MTELYLTFTREVFNNTYITLLALIGGIVPALFWLHFWLKEDRKRPEPKSRIALTFIFGMLLALAIIPFQHFIEALIVSSGVLMVVTTAFSEEFFKYLAAYFTSLRTKVAEEPIDSIIYLITAALGFSAFENFLYLLAPLFESKWLDSLTLVNFRFVGASLVHVAASGIIGIFLAFSFRKSPAFRRMMLVFGLILATSLHTLFNLLIIKGELVTMLSILIMVWIAIVVILLFFEKVKTLLVDP